MCKCNECDKKDTENCIRILEIVGYQQTKTMSTIEMKCLQDSYNNLLKGIEKMIQLMSSEAFWKIRDIEKGNECD